MHLHIKSANNSNRDAFSLVGTLSTLGWERGSRPDSEGLPVLRAYSDFEDSSFLSRLLTKHHKRRQPASSHRDLKSVRQGHKFYKN